MIIAVTKFTKGAWIPIVVIPVIVAVFKAIKSHYDDVAKSLRIPEAYRPRRMNHTVVVLVGSVHRGVLEALAYARSLHPDRLLAVTVVSDEEEQERIERSWSALDIDVPLEIVHSPYRELTAPIMRFVDELDAALREQRDHGRLAGVRRRLVVGPAPPQPERPVAQGSAAVPQGHGRHLGPVPPRGVIIGPSSGT